ncbi:hypothetical protein [Anaerotignum propionicum]|uniref:hypothetical protein n=1 Tax=Anaerotignum propionicum TaxID=28446 RepID=UPI00289972DD|nr:hypothetical protein [Anaerotignum propionicum]
MNRKVTVLNILTFFCALSTFITYVILNERLIGCVLAFVLCCLQCLLMKLAKKEREANNYEDKIEK